MIDREALAKETRWIGFALKRLPSACCQLPKDVLDEAAHWGFARAVCEWDGRGAFSTYAVHSIKHAIGDQVRQELHNQGYTSEGKQPKRCYTQSKRYDPVAQKYRKRSEPLKKRQSSLDALAFKKGLMMV